MKMIAALAALPLLLLAALGLAAYQMVASIPPWLLIVVIVYLLCKQGRPSRARPVSGQSWSPAVLPPPRTGSAAQPAATPQPPVVVVLVEAREKTPPRPSSAPEPWLLT